MCIRDRRYRARKCQSEQYRMPWSGLRGQRTSLIPHQLHIALSLIHIFTDEETLELLKKYEEH